MQSFYRSACLVPFAFDATMHKDAIIVVGHTLWNGLPRSKAFSWNVLSHSMHRSKHVMFAVLEASRRGSV